MSGLSTPIYFTYKGGYRSKLTGYKSIRLQVHPTFVTADQLTRLSNRLSVLAEGGDNLVVNNDYYASVTVQYADKVYYVFSDIQHL